MSFSSAGPENNDLEGIDQDENIEKQAIVFDIVQIILQFLNRIFDGGSVLIAYLRPTGYPRLDAMPDVIKRNLLTELLDEKRPFRTRPDETHLAFENIEDLREFINPQFTDDGTNTRSTRV